MSEKLKESVNLMKITNKNMIKVNWATIKDNIDETNKILDKLLNRIISGEKSITKKDMEKIIKLDPIIKETLKNTKNMNKELKDKLEETIIKYNKVLKFLNQIKLEKTKKT